MRDFESCMQSITWSGRWPDNKAIGTRVIYSESEEAPASSASMLGTPMHSSTGICVIYTLVTGADVPVLNKTIQYR